MLLAVVPQTESFDDSLVWDYDAGSWSIFIQEEPVKGCLMSKEFEDGAFIELFIVSEDKVIDFYYGSPNLFVETEAEYPLRLKFTESSSWGGEGVAFEAVDGTPAIWLQFSSELAYEFMMELRETELMSVSTGAALLGAYELGRADIAITELEICQGIMQVGEGFKFSHLLTTDL